MFCLVNLSLLVIKRQEHPPAGFRIPALIPVLALASNMILMAAASRDSHFLAIGFIAVGLLLVLIQQTLEKRIKRA